MIASSIVSRFGKDPRWLQIAFLSSFLCAGLTVLRFDVPACQPAMLLGSACFTQWLCVRLFKAREVGYLSPVISALGLSLLMRTDVWWLCPVVAAVAISSKFVLRVAGKHVFNPTNLGLATAMLATSHAWCSPAQWGEGAVLLAWVLVLGLTVAHRAFRTDVSLAFLVSWGGLKLLRVLFLGQRFEVLLHQISVGSLILFTFFMISDPKTTPNRPAARILFGASVAALAFFLQHQLWINNALVWSLFVLSPVVPLLDRLFPAERFVWPRSSPTPTLKDAACHVSSA